MEATVNLSGVQFNVKIDTSEPRVENVSLGGINMTQLIYDNELQDEILEKLEKQIEKHNQNQKEEYEERTREFYTR